MKKTAIIILLLSLYYKGYCQYGAASFYVVAHPDQWQLFMGNNAYNDITKSEKGKENKVVFIYTTAGQESCNGTPLNTSVDIARQDGAHNCVEFCADRSGSHGQWSLIPVTVQGHSILKYTYKNVVSYWLRLPDGCSGQGLYGQSLQFLHDGTLSSIKTVDSSTTYKGWDDLAGTIRQIIVNESADVNEIVLNTADTDASINSGDDPDHIYTGMLCINAVDSIPNTTLNLFMESVIATLPANLDYRAIANKAALLSQLDYVRTENGLPSEWTPHNISYLNRNYFRTVTK